MALIDVILPVYNGAVHLRESIESVLIQTAKDFRLFIVNDCSTDNSREIIAEYIHDERVVFFQNKNNIGLFPSLNLLIRKSDSKLIHLWAQDDVMKPSFLENAILFHHKHPEISFSYCAVSIIDDRGVEIVSNFVDYTPELITPVLHDKIALYTGSITGNICNVTLKREAIEKVGLFDESMKMSGDFDMWVKLTATSPIGRIAEPLICLRNHPQQLSRQLKKKYFSSLEDLKIYDVVFGRVDDELMHWGELYFKRYKLTYYYNLAIKMLLNGDVILGLKLIKLINDRCSIWKLQYYSTKNKFSRSDKNLTDNKFLFV